MIPDPLLPFIPQGPIEKPKKSLRTLLDPFRIEIAIRGQGNTYSHLVTPGI